MEVQIQNPQYIGIVKFKKNAEDHGVSLYFTPSISNCKLVTLDSVCSFFTYIKDENDRIECFKKFMTQIPNKNIFLTLTSKESAEWFKNNFTLYYLNEVPCGYGNGLQYHVLIKNHSDPRKPIENVTIVKEKVDKVQIINIINNAFNATVNRNNRLKLIEEGIDALNNQ